MYVPNEDNYIVDGQSYAPTTTSSEKKPKKKSSMKLIVIIIIIALTLGFVVYFVSNLIFGGKGEQTIENNGISSTLSVDDPDVLDIYAKVTYGRNSNTLNKFQKEQFVSLKDFSNFEKYYYSFSSLQRKDLRDEENNQYSISSVVVDELMHKYFGPDVTYLKQGTIPIVLDHSFEQGNTLSLTYNVDSKKYMTTLTKTDNSNSSLVPISISKLESASKESDGTLVLVERVIYINSSQNNGAVSYKVYRDFNHTMLIDSKDNVSLEDYQKNPISADTYGQQGNLITYQFKQNNGDYYFYQSKIEQ